MAPSKLGVLSLLLLSSAAYGALPTADFTVQKCEWQVDKCVANSLNALVPAPSTTIDKIAATYAARDYRCTEADTTNCETTGYCTLAVSVCTFDYTDFNYAISCKGSKATKLYVCQNTTVAQCSSNSDCEAKDLLGLGATECYTKGFSATDLIDYTTKVTLLDSSYVGNCDAVKQAKTLTTYTPVGVTVLEKSTSYANAKTACAAITTEAACEATTLTITVSKATFDLYSTPAGLDSARNSAATSAVSLFGMAFVAFISLTLFSQI